MKDDVQKVFRNFEALKKEYDLNEEKLTVRMVLRKVGEQLEMNIKMMMQILQPEEYHAMHEGSYFTDKDKQKVFDLYTKMMILHREILKSEIKNDDKDMIATINLAHSDMQKMKPELLDIVQKMQDSWKKVSTKNEVRYFG